MKDSGRWDLQTPGFERETLRSRPKPLTAQGFVSLAELSQSSQMDDLSSIPVAHVKTQFEWVLLFRNVLGGQPNFSDQ